MRRVLFVISLFVITSLNVSATEKMFASGRLVFHGSLRLDGCAFKDSNAHAERLNIDIECPLDRLNEIILQELQLKKKAVEVFQKQWRQLTSRGSIGIRKGQDVNFKGLVFNRLAWEPRSEPIKNQTITLVRYDAAKVVLVPEQSHASPADSHRFVRTASLDNSVIHFMYE